MSDSNNSEGESDDGLDELLNFQPFSQQSHQQDDEDNDEKADGKGVVGALDASGSPDDEREGERKASSSSLAAGGGEHRGGGGEDDDRDFVAAIASKRADAATLPSEVTSTSQLFWYFKKPKNATPGKRRKRSNPSSDTEGTMIHVPSSTTKYHPCRTCDPGEAKGLAMPQEWDQEKKVLCQFIGIPMGEKNLYSRSTLIPFHNLRGYDYDSAGVVDPTVSPLDEGQDEGGAAGGGTTTGDDREEGIRGSGSEKVGWCPRLIARYEKQVVGENKKQVGGGNPEEAAKTAVFFLDRVLEHAREEERRLRLERREQREEQLSMEVDWNENDDDVEDHDHEEELEEPYTQNLNVGAPGASMARLRTVERKKEPIRPGDVITYRSHLYVAGDKRGVKTTTVLAVDPAGDPILTLDNGDFLPPDTHVKRVKIVKGGGKGGTAGESRLEDHPFGMFRAIEHFKLEKLGRIDDGGNGDFRSREARRVGQVLQKNMAELREKTKDMALPVDIMNRYRGAERIAGVATAGTSKTKAGATSKKNPSTSTKKGKDWNVATTGGSEVRVTKRKVRIRESHDRCSPPEPGLEMKQKVGELTARDDDLDFDSSDEDEVRRREPNLRTVGNPNRCSSYKSSDQGTKKPKKGRQQSTSPESGLEESNSEDEIQSKKRKVRIMDSPDHISFKSSSGQKETTRQKKAAGRAVTAGDDKYAELLNSSSNEDETPAMPQNNARVTESIELLSSQDSRIQTKKTKQKNVGAATGDCKYAELLESGSSQDEDPPTGPRPNGPGTKTIQPRASRNSDIQKQTNCKKSQKRIGRQLKGNDDGERPADESVTKDKSQKRRKAKDVTVSPRGNAALVSSQTSSSDSSLDDFETPSRRTKISKGKQNSGAFSSSTDPPKSKRNRVGAGRTPPTRASPRKKTPERAEQSKQPRLRVTRQK